VITALGIGEAVVTVMNERGAPTPVAWTRLRAPESLMGTAEAAVMESTVKGSALFAKYSQAIDRESAREKLAAKLEAGAAAAEAEVEAGKQKPESKIAYPKQPKQQEQGSVVSDIMQSSMAKDLLRTATREIVRGIFGTGRRR
jgi:uncharacterized protein